MRNVLVLVLAGLLVLLVGALGLGAYRLAAETRGLRARLEAARVPVQPRTIDFAELADLPAPVSRYLAAVLADGGPMLSSVRLAHEGLFDTGETGIHWKPFTSDQLSVTRRPGFDWEGRVAVAPGVNVRVHDAYVAGSGRLHASLLGLVSVAKVRGTRAAAEGELMRFLAEAAWYPTALLPSQGARWEPVDDRTARVTLVDEAVTVTLELGFGSDDLIERVRAEARGRMVGGELVATPWEGRFWNYAERGGLLVPLEGEVAWLLPEGTRPYWRGRLVGYVPAFAD